MKQIIVVVVLFCSGCGVFAPSMREETLPTWQADDDHVVTSSATLRMVAHVRGQDVVLPEGWEILIETDDHYLLATADDQQMIEVHAGFGDTSCDEVTEVIAREHAVGHAPQYGSSGCMVEYVSTDISDTPTQEDDMSFHVVAIDRVTIWEQDGVFVRVASSAGSSNHQTAIALASRLAAILAH